MIKKRSGKKVKINLEPKQFMNPIVNFDNNNS